MKIKADFVTNSSSTSFTFIFKGNHIDLFKAVLKRAALFNLSIDFGTPYTIDVWDVIESIDSVIRFDPGILQIDNEIKMCQEDIEYVEKNLAKNNIEDWERRYDKERRADLNEVMTKLLKAKEKGLVSVFKIGFGDNHGEICGGRIGCTMDCAGSRISIDDDDLIVMTEQNR